LRPIYSEEDKAAIRVGIKEGANDVNLDLKSR
jgi:hypothetical protein